MSLVIAFIGIQGAVMAGDMREIITRGDRISTGTLEHELYSGLIVNDDDLTKRAGELGISLTLRDDKRKVTHRDGILVGEVSETEGGVTRKRRLYATAGEYALADITDADLRFDRERYCKQLRCAGKPGNKKDSTFLHPGTLEKRQHARCHQDTYAYHGTGIEGDRVCERIVYPDTYPGKNQSFCSYRTGQQTGTCLVFPPSALFL